MKPDLDTIRNIATLATMTPKDAIYAECYPEHLEALKEAPAALKAALALLDEQTALARYATSRANDWFSIAMRQRTRIDELTHASWSSQSLRAQNQHVKELYQRERRKRQAMALRNDIATCEAVTTSQAIESWQARLASGHTRRLSIRHRAGRQQARGVAIRDAIMEFLEAWYAHGNLVGPSIKEIGEHVGLSSSSSVHGHLTVMRREHRIAPAVKSKPRSVIPTSTAKIGDRIIHLAGIVCENSTVCVDEAEELIRLLNTVFGGEAHNANS